MFFSFHKVQNRQKDPPILFFFPFLSPNRSVPTQECSSYWSASPKPHQKEKKKIQPPQDTCFRAKHMINWFFIFVHIASVQHCLSPPFKLINCQNTSPCSFPSKEGHLHRNSRVPNYACKKGSHLPELFHHLLTQLHILHYILNSHTTPCTACAHEFCGTTHPTKSNASMYLGLHLRRSKYLKQLSFILSSLVPPLPSYGSIHFLFYPSLHYFPSILASSF